MSDNKWFFRPKPNPNASLTIICFPYAGGSASTYMPWPQYLPDSVEIIAIQPPGRANRMFEERHKDMKTLIKELLKYFPSIIDRPYILYGHSLGSRVAFELMHCCQMKGMRLPLHFIASGSRAPHLSSRKEPIHHLPDSEFVDKLRDLKGIPVEVLENQELMSLCMPLLRDDFRISETYLYTSDATFDCHLTVLGGECQR